MDAMSPSSIENELFANGDLAVGDAVVHIEHGLARFEGYGEIEVADTVQKVVHLRYRNGGKLTLPIKEGRDLWPYGARAADVRLDRLDNDDWLKRRDQLISELKESAARLSAIRENKSATRAPKLEIDDDAAADLASGFAFEETEDQTAAIEKIRADLASERPMDRLLVGDVGFGKTEVAIRAIGIAVFAGHQAAIMVPTTVLARQHFDTLKARFEPLGKTVMELSGLASDADAEAVREAVANGSCDILVATHALTTGRIDFARPGLFVVDEEQKFGVARKDAIHELAKGSHVLTMTATPLPRSLAAAECGLMSVSLLTTPPADRKAIVTKIGDLNTDLLLHAIEKEVARGGQCYVVCPRVSGTKKLKTVLRDHADDWSFKIAHGKQDKSKMEGRMLAFMKGEFDVLVSTTIIESGLDNPRANTMVIWNAERFGLAQLHQLRGRVGRSKTPAQMLLLTRKKLEGKSEAMRRLKLFSELSEIGDGFKIARRDRDLRGFGKLEGDEQSGQVSKLGIGLYRHILTTELKRLEPAIEPGS